MVSVETLHICRLTMVGQQNLLTSSMPQQKTRSFQTAAKIWCLRAFCSMSYHSLQHRTLCRKLSGFSNQEAPWQSWCGLYSACLQQLCFCAVTISRFCMQCMSVLAVMRCLSVQACVFNGACCCECAWHVALCCVHWQQPLTVHNARCKYHESVPTCSILKGGCF